MRRLLRPGVLLTVGAPVLLAACTAATVDTAAFAPSTEKRAGVSPSPIVVATGDHIPSGGGRRQIGAPYEIEGTWYKPEEDPSYDRVGMASWYGADFHGRMTANGEVFDSAALTAAHPTMPLPSYARVTNVGNGRSIIVRVNDRGPYSHNRLIDVSERTADMLGFRRGGSAQVRVQYVGKAPVEGNDAGFLLASYSGDDAGRALALNAPPARRAGEIAGVSPAPPFILASAAGTQAQGSAAGSAARSPKALVAFAETAPGQDDPASVLTTPIGADARILMAFESASFADE